MGFMNYMPVVMMVVFFLVGLLAIVLVGAVVAAIVWGLKKGNVKVTTGGRNFDDFGR